MGYKLATYISLLFFIGIGAFFFISSQTLPKSSSGQIGPAYFPGIVSVLLILCCILSFFTTMKKNDQHIPLPNLRYIIWTIVLSALFTAVWEWMGLFYIVSFVFLAILIYLYDQAKPSFIKVCKAMGISLLMVLLVYGTFELLLGITF
ncbi:tripartite tricarboxylate transporter TctB family protein [Paenibacillus validus]|uniref:DUF1468 domain-containing protein n=1 Tax=Paenibacillus validus TaxID=44253 RepID=A0A7X2ZF02_9BACL|nr:MULTISPECIES: tripartite tricarboxylate transporter TctB family protein [Paenibacillus]MED4601379.1 tripartite tricarboxylate transporter TctB family protein [Paenibacillus validus]MED4605076.1 tripartite tricarboxylate transporter TctB family protein [Paenibacillus validus]MUG72931.1 hypothetical protein [Paenibacillus validus]